MKDIVIFGFKDSLTGQLINMLDKRVKKKINCIISFSNIPKANLSSLNKKNKKTEFIVKNKIFNLPVFNKNNFIKILKKKKIKQAFILEDSSKDRCQIFKHLKKNNIKILTFIHKSVKLMGNNDIGEGSIIFPDCYVGYKSDIGNCSIVQSGCRIEHHNMIGSFCNFNPNIVLGGFAKIGNLCAIGMSVDIINNITIGNYSQIGAGSLVLKDVGCKQVHFGRPAKFIRVNKI